MMEIWDGMRLTGSDGFVVLFVGTDSPGIFDVVDEDFAIADFTGFGGLDDGIDGGFDDIVGNNGFEFDFWEKIDGVFISAIDFGMAFLPTEAFDFGDAHT